MNIISINLSTTIYIENRSNIYVANVFLSVFNLLKNLSIYFIFSPLSDFTNIHFYYPTKSEKNQDFWVIIFDFLNSFS